MPRGFSVCEWDEATIREASFNHPKSPIGELIMEIEKTLPSDLVAVEDSALDNVAGGYGFFPFVKVNAINFQDNVVVAGDDVNFTFIQG